MLCVSGAPNRQVPAHGEQIGGCQRLVGVVAAGWVLASLWGAGRILELGRVVHDTPS